jgi:hypothetical protein
MRRTFRILPVVLGLAMGGFFASAASAGTTVNVSQTLDLTQASTSVFSPQLQSVGVGFSPNVDFSLAVGDTLDYNLAFQGGQSIHGTNLVFTKAAFFSSSGNPQLIDATGQLVLFDAGHNAVFTSAVNTEEVANSFGQDFLFAPIPSISFSSLEYIATVTGYTPFAFGTPTNSLEYGTTLFQVGVGAGGSVGISVPEPASWALMLTGFFGLGAMLRRSRARPGLATA